MAAFVSAGLGPADPGSCACVRRSPPCSPRTPPRCAGAPCSTPPRRSPTAGGRRAVTDRRSWRAPTPSLRAAGAHAVADRDAAPLEAAGARRDQRGPALLRPDALRRAASRRDASSDGVDELAGARRTRLAAAACRMGSWIGGDRDGNPFVDRRRAAPRASTARPTEALGHHLDALARLALELSMSSRLVTPDGRRSRARRRVGRRLAVPRRRALPPGAARHARPPAATAPRAARRRARTAAARRAASRTRDPTSCSPTSTSSTRRCASHGAGALADGRVAPVRACASSCSASTCARSTCARTPTSTRRSWPSCWPAPACAVDYLALAEASACRAAAPPSSRPPDRCAAPQQRSATRPSASSPSSTRRPRPCAASAGRHRRTTSSPSASRCSDVLEVAVLLRRPGCPPGEPPPRRRHRPAVRDDRGPRGGGAIIARAARRARRTARWSTAAATPGGDARLLRHQQGRRLPHRQLGRCTAPRSTWSRSPAPRRAACACSTAAAAPWAAAAGRAYDAILAQPPGSGRRGAPHHRAGRGRRRQVRRSPTLARRNLEALVAATLEATRRIDADGRRRGDDRYAHRGDGRAVGLGVRARLPRAGLRDRRFVECSAPITPIAEIAQLNIGSRPASRTTSDRIEDLRAIPWVFCWSQCRLMLPGWYGAGTAFEAWAGGDPSAARPAARAARDVAVLPHRAVEHGDGAGQVRPAASPRRYAELVADHADRAASSIASPPSTPAPCVGVLRITGHDVAAGRQPVAGPQHPQPLPLPRPAAPPAGRDAAPPPRRRRRRLVQRAIHLTINGVATGLRNSG